MTKQYLITLAINFCLFHNKIYESDVIEIMEYLDSFTIEEILRDYNEIVEEITL
jgi:hypothetical protein